MDISGNLLIIVGIVIVLLGIFAGMLLSTLRDEGEPEEDTSDLAPPGGRKGRYTPLVRIWREKGTGALVVEIDGKSFLSPEPLDPTQRERLDRTARDLRTWLGMGMITAQPEEELPAAPPARPASAAAEAVPANGTPPAASAPAQPAQPYAVPPPVQPAAYAEPIRHEPLAVVSGKSIVMQIEDILQDMISGTPLGRRGLHLLEDPSRGVLVQLGPNTFDGIDAVPEPDVQATIRAAVAEWEKSQ